MGLFRSLLKPHTLFLWLGLVFGSMFAVLTPPFDVPDEPAHYLRVMELAQGAILRHSELPGAFVTYVRGTSARATDQSNNDYYHSMPLNKRLQEVKGAFTERQEGSASVRMPYNRAIMYTPAPYLAAIPAVWLTSFFHFSPAALLYLEREFLFLCSTLLIYFAIRQTPVLQWQFFLLMLFPTSVFLRSSVNADALTLAYILLFTALIFKTLLVPETLTFRRIAILSVLSFLLCLSKSAYMLLPLLFLAAPKPIFTSVRQRVLAYVLILALPIAAGVLWTHEVQLLIAGEPFPVETLHHNMTFSKPLNVDEQAQLSFALHHYCAFLRILLHTLASNALMYIGLGIGLVETRTVLPVPLVFLLFFFLMTLPTNWTCQIRWPLRLVCAVLFAATFIGIFLALFVTCTPVGEESIIGVHGRYFVPVMPLLLLAVSYRPFLRPLYGVQVVAAIVLTAYLLYTGVMAI